MNTKTLTLSRSLIDELIFTLALPDKPVVRCIVWFLLRKILTRMANIGATFDEILGESGLQPASEWAVRQFARAVTSEGQENIPEKGPLIIVSNHPGTIDAVVLFSQIPREDLICISSYIPFLDKLPNLKERLILTSKTSRSNRARTAIKATQHLRSGGSLLYFGAGHLEPDPAVMKGCTEMMDSWLKGLEFFLRHVPDLQITPAIVSGVIAPRWAHSRVQSLRRKQVDRVRLSNYAQVIYQLLFPGRMMVSPFVSFAPAYRLADLNGAEANQNLTKTIISRSKVLLAEHCSHFGTAME